MSRTDKAFWVTVIPIVVLWNTVRIPLLSRMGEVFGFDVVPPAAGLVVGNLVVSCALAAAAGYSAAIIAAPKRIGAGFNVAVGVTIAFGLQNFIEYRQAGVSILYFAAVPVLAALAAVAGSVLCFLTRAGYLPRGSYSDDG
jgi:hypothetical protein